ncbi:MAG: lysylphosphatidylglycerol synthase domain-containing protein [Bacteroidota bacterium]
MNKNKSLWSIFIKLAIVLVSCWFIYQKVFIKERFTDYQNSYRQFIDNGDHILILTLVMALMLLNWGLESIKWKMMVRKIERITFFKAIEAVCSGITVSFFTPNRVGEFAGRVFYLDKADRIKAALIAVIGSFGQTIVTITFGGLSLILYCHDILKLDLYLFLPIAAITFLLVLSLCLFYFNTPILTLLSDKIDWLRKYHKYTEVFSYFTKKELMKVFLLCILRYLVFSLQYYLLLIISDVPLSFLQGMMMISMVFFIVTVVPTIALTEIGVRGASATYFIGMISTNHFGILLASFTLWIINLVIPSILGAVFAFNFKLFRN